MRRVFLLLQASLSAARRGLLSRVVWLLIRVIVASKRIVDSFIRSLTSRGVSASTLSTGLDTPSHQDVHRIRAPDRYMPSSLPTELRTQQQNTSLPRRSIMPATTPRVLPKPFIPGWYQRYNFRQPVKKRPNKEKVKAGQVSFLEDVPSNWERIIHPEGARYYFDAHRNVFTDINLVELGDLQELDACIQFLRERESQLSLDSTFQRYPTQLVIQLVHSDQWVYYFVNHETHTVFWIEDIDLDWLLPQKILGVTEDSHIRYAVETQYWVHCEQYPNSIPLLQEHVTEMWGIVAFLYIDSITSVASLCPLSQEELLKVLGLMPYLQCDFFNWMSGFATLVLMQCDVARICATDGYAMWILARIMRILVQAKFYDFHGQPGARLEADMSVYVQEDHSDEKHVLIHLLDFLSWFILHSYIEELKSIWVDDTINYARWSKFASDLTTGWNGFTIYSTVMLAVDVSLLAVPATSKGDVNSQSVAIVATNMSLLCIVGSLVSSVLLVMQINALNTSADAAQFMQKMTHWRGGTIVLGIIFSLPYALLVWAMIFFSLALTYIIFQTTDPASLSVMIVGMVTVSSVVSLPAWWGKDFGGFIKWVSILKGKFQLNRTAKLQQGEP